jgi:hypothetical protein
MFIETTKGNLVNVNEIVAVYPARGGANAKLRDDDIVSIGWPTAFLERAGCPVLPAQPGFERLIAHLDGEDLFVERNPIVGWRAMLWGPEPIVVEEEYNETANNRQTIKCPDGQVIVTGDRTFESEAKWRTETERELKEQAKEPKTA